jgi:hypothetical protein
MIESRRLYNACFHAAVAASQAFIVVVAGRRDRAARASVHLRYHGAKRHRTDATRPSPVLLRYELAVLDVRRLVDGAGGRPPELHQRDKASHRQYQ